MTGPEPQRGRVLDPSEIEVVEDLERSILAPSSLAGYQQRYQSFTRWRHGAGIGLPMGEGDLMRYLDSVGDGWGYAHAKVSLTAIAWGLAQEGHPDPRGQQVKAWLRRKRRDQGIRVEGLGGSDATGTDRPIEALTSEGVALLAATLAPDPDRQTHLDPARGRYALAREIARRTGHPQPLAAARGIPWDSVAIDPDTRTATVEIDGTSVVVTADHDEIGYTCLARLAITPHTVQRPPVEDYQDVPKPERPRSLARAVRAACGGEDRHASREPAVGRDDLRRLSDDAWWWVQRCVDPRLDRDLRDLVLLLVSHIDGTRFANLVEIHWEHAVRHTDGWTLHVIRHKPASTGSMPYPIPVSHHGTDLCGWTCAACALDDLAEYQQRSFGRCTGPILATYYGGTWRAMTSANARMQLRSIATRAGLPDQARITTRSLRSGAIVSVKLAGGSDAQAQALARHASPDTTQIYLRPLDPAIVEFHLDV